MPKQMLKCSLKEEVDSSLYQPQVPDEELFAFYCEHSSWYSEKMRYTVAEDKWVIELFPYSLDKKQLSPERVAYNPSAKADFSFVIRGKGSQFVEILKIASETGRNLFREAHLSVFLDDPVEIINSYYLITGITSDIEYGQYPIIEVNLYSDSDDLVLDFEKEDRAFFWSLSLSPKILDLMIQNESSIEIFNPPPRMS